MVAVHTVCNFGDPRAIGAVHENEHLAFPWHERAKHGLKAEGATSLDWNADMAFFATSKMKKRHRIGTREF